MTLFDHGTGYGRLVFALASSVVIPLAPLGCADPGPPRGSVTGRITYNDRPVPKGTVTFVSTQVHGRNATGAIRPDGTYWLQTEAPRDGAIVGDYKVTVSARDDVILDYTPRKAIPPKRLTPARYEDPDASGLTAAVKIGANTCDFDLKP